MPSDDPQDEITRAEIAQIADQAAQRAVERLCDRLSIDPNDHGSVEDTRDAIMWAKGARDGQRRLRDAASNGAAKAAGGGLAMGVLYLLWWIVTTFSKSKGGP